MTENTSFAIQASGLGRDFGATRVLKNVSMSIPTGSVCALLGQNGAGKTTLLKLLMGLIQATAGVSSVLDDQGWPRQMRTLSRVGCLLDGFEPTGATRIRHLQDLSRAASPQFDTLHARRLLDSHGLAPSRRWSTLSKGQKRWVLLALMLCRQCDVLLLDEPADGLDPQSRIELYQLIRQQANDRNITALIATHVITDIERVADQVCILHEHSIQLQADLEELREQVQVIQFDASRPPGPLPAGVEQVHKEDRDGVRLWVRDRANALGPTTLGNEIRRRKPNLEELFLAITGSQATPI